jgi:MFS family permease
MITGDWGLGHPITRGALSDPPGSMLGVDVQPYRDLLRLPGVAKLLGFSIFARVPRAAMGVVLTLHVVIGLDHGYGAAGLLVAAATVGSALGAPWRGRAIDRLGLRRALVPSLVAEVAFWGASPFLGYEALLVASLLYGVLAVPTFGIIRQSLGVMVPPERQRPAFALDSMSVEVTFMIAPAAAVLLATQVSTTAALVASGVANVASGVWFFLLDPPTRSEGAAAAEPVPHATGGWRPSWLTAPLALLLVTTLGALLVLGGTDVAIVASLREQDALGVATMVFLAWSVGSLAGGLVFGAMHRPVSPAFLLLVMGLATAPIGLAPGPWWLVLAILPAGIICAPVLSATAAEATALAPERVRGEVMGWYGSAMTAGLSLGAPLAGKAADVFGGWGGFAAVGVLGAGVGAAVLVAERARRPRARSAAEPAGEPQDETVPEKRSLSVTGADPGEWSARYQD